MNIFQLINEELQNVQLLIHKNFKIKAGHISDFISLDLNYLDFHLRPGIVILSNRLFGPVTERTIALAAVLQFIFLASRVHLNVIESGTGRESAPDNRFKYQYPILVGDYLYGKFFTTLCDAGIVHYLKKLAKLICTINKGGILNHKYKNREFGDKQQYYSIIRKESAELLACSAYLGADLGGAGTNAKRHLYNFGLNLGMAFGLLEKGASLKQVSQYILSAESILNQFPPGEETDCFRNLLTLLKKDNSVLQRMVI
ncbi:polyprenyl synthetase family protein [Desulfallas sp. Bu1-1]|uniref:polyprenyl synthetase family protein n=1 Tax=Desulfallas sp. Bu1-1 TaxID=2787620 RepID=UPI0018A0B9B7|nr:polyprenyl synthetase family protein [Desulfallas sp. Bu1-1]MBF7084098.1 polyprenyl synthetase family protein [Desulfallas sp. Bu1-1]